MLLAECADVLQLIGAMIAEVRYQASEHGYGDTILMTCLTGLLVRDR